MNKNKLLLGVVIFILFLAIGFCATGQGIEWLLQFFGGGKSAFVNQTNYMIIRVNALEDEKPQVVSIWGTFVYLDNPVSIKLKPLYPSANPQGDLAALSFSLAADGLPTPEFINLVKSTFDMPVDNYLLVDDQGLRTLYAWSENLDPASIPEDITPAEIELFESGCSQIQSKNISPTTPDWGMIIPDHFRTNFNFDKFMTQWKTISGAGADLDCEALTND